MSSGKIEEKVGWIEELTWLALLTMRGIARMVSFR
jgi:hypothetical protein